MSGLIGSLATGIFDKPRPASPPAPRNTNGSELSGAIENHVVQSTLSILSIGQMVLYVKLLGEIISVLSPQQNRILHK
jgi:hypothetical protein